MKNLTLSLVIISLSFLFCNKVEASFQSDVTNCLTIKNADDRLDCYDTVVKYYKLNPSKSTTVKNTTTNTSAPKSVPGKPTPSKSPNLTVGVPMQNAVPGKVSTTDNFGQNEAETEDAVESIQSRIIGQFSSWEKGMILELENGQKWKVTSTGRGYKKMDNPKITISRGFFGSFNAKVDGLNAGAKVKRVK